MGISILLTSKKDPTADYLEKAFRRKNHQISRISLGIDKFPLFNLDVNDLGWILDDKNNKIKVTDINAIIIRRPRIPLFDENDRDNNRFLSRELLHGLRSLLESSDAIWMNHPDNNAFASSKPKNLLIAKDLGLNIPKTLISSSPQEISAFLSENDSCIIKPISYGLMERENSAKMAFTQRIPNSFDINKYTRSGIPILIQEEIKKDFDIRVTIVGNKVFSAGLSAKSDYVDWRQEIDSKWVKYEIPKLISNACVKMCKILKLNFAAIDFVIDKRGRYYFLELNPNGQWVWIEEDTGLKISDQIVNYLTGGPYEN